MRGQNRGKIKSFGRVRLGVQLAFAAFFNGYAKGFAQGRIFTGSTKAVCVPVLNCYSCPGALGACPIGSLQAVAGSRGRSLSFYVLGFLMLFGLVFGRLLCGFACPFGLVQDLLSKLPVKKRRLPDGVDRPLRRVKYLMLAAVLLLPALASYFLGSAAPPYFCKYFCPAGTLEAGLPLLAAKPILRQQAGMLWGWKCIVLICILLGAVLIPRFFCRYFCPLGALYGLLSRFTLYRMTLQQGACVHCGACEETCPMGLDPAKPDVLGSSECIRCGKCKAACPCSAIRSGFGQSAQSRKAENPAH